MYSEKQGVLASFTSGKGRLNRWAYFGRTMLLGLLSVMLFGLAGMLTGRYDLAGRAVFLVFIVPLFFLNQQRLHDIGKYYWIAPVYAAVETVVVMTTDYSNLENADATNPLSYINMVLGLYMLFKKGQEGENEYGPDPLER